MRETLLTINTVYFLFGATIYCGVMWALRFFFYPSWSKMTVDNVHDHFIIPTSAATRFFLVVVPIMFFSGIVMVITEWGDGWTFVATLIAFAGIVVSTYVGWIHIIPVNRIIKAGVAETRRSSASEEVDDAEQHPLGHGHDHVGRGVWYIIAKGNFPGRGLDRDDLHATASARDRGRPRLRAPTSGALVQPATARTRRDEGHAVGRLRRLPRQARAATGLQRLGAG
jgi:hypothetical protein